MSPENTSLLHDARALMRESRHVKRASGWADLVGQLAAALERSEAQREELQAYKDLYEARRDGKTRIITDEKDARPSR